MAAMDQKHSVDEMMAADIKEGSDDSSVDYDYNDIGSIIMDDAIKTEMDLSDDEIV